MLRAILIMIMVVLLYVFSLKVGLDLVSKNRYVIIDDITISSITIFLIYFLILFILDKIYELRYKPDKEEFIDNVIYVIISVILLFMLTGIFGNVIIYAYSKIKDNVKIENKVVTKDVRYSIDNKDKCTLILDNNKTVTLDTPCIKCNDKYMYVYHIYRKYTDMLGYKIVLDKEEDKLVICK